MYAYNDCGFKILITDIPLQGFGYVCRNDSTPKETNPTRKTFILQRATSYVIQSGTDHIRGEIEQLDRREWKEINPNAEFRRRASAV